MVEILRRARGRGGDTSNTYSRGLYGDGARGMGEMVGGLMRVGATDGFGERAEVVKEADGWIERLPLSRRGCLRYETATTPDTMMLTTTTTPMTMTTATTALTMTAIFGPGPEGALVVI